MTVLVTGATGSVGRCVVDALLARGAQVRALTKDPDRARLPDVVDVVRGTVTDPGTPAAAMAGIRAVYLPSAPATTATVAHAAREAGVERLVDLSGEPDSWWGTVAAAVEDSGLAWTHLWPGDFMENSTLWAAQIRARGGVAEPWPEAASTPTAMVDIADVAAVALPRTVSRDGRCGSPAPRP